MLVVRPTTGGGTAVRPGWSRLRQPAPGRPVGPRLAAAPSADRRSPVGPHAGLPVPGAGGRIGGQGPLASLLGLRRWRPVTAAPAVFSLPPPGYPPTHAVPVPLLIPSAAPATPGSAEPRPTWSRACWKPPGPRAGRLLVRGADLAWPGVGSGFRRLWRRAGLAAAEAFVAGLPGRRPAGGGRPMRNASPGRGREKRTKALRRAGFPAAPRPAPASCWSCLTRRCGSGGRAGTCWVGSWP